ncbi:hypothetical protein AVEN_139212-1 [Araneus ventricosus]|uniref:Uncharacterized protein n=1 Tax=Araneus ventricosus TaxID=182803 RepID=A0A4Y2WL85_ARAVE|nr:hypothetical protein AVEN_139212-1 [Araneus ventricosus]
MQQKTDFLPTRENRRMQHKRISSLPRNVGCSRKQISPFNGWKSQDAAEKPISSLPAKIAGWQKTDFLPTRENRRMQHKTDFLLPAEIAGCSRKQISPYLRGNVDAAEK